MTLVRKARAGSDSFGHEWPKDGSVVDVDYDQALVLVAIPDGGFSVAEDTPEPAPAAEPEAISEVDPDPEQSVDEAPKRTRQRRTSTS